MTHILVSGSGGAPMVAREEIRTREDRLGLEGDRYALGTGYWSDHRWEPVTLVAEEALERVGERLGRPVDPATVRRNLVTRGVDLADLIGRRFRVGEMVLEGTRPCDPCRYLEEHAGIPGLRARLEGQGGLRANIVTGGTIRLGDEVEAIV